MRRLMMRTVIVAGLAYLLGFAVFAEHVAQLRPPDPAPRVDAVVALTGGADRIATAKSLLDGDLGARLLISGVNPSTSEEDVRRLAGGTDQAFACCVDLGRAATTTRENAVEVAAWTRQNDFASVYVVTSDYHLPRALLELGAHAQDVAFIGWPVRAQTPWWRDGSAVRRLVVEYPKFLVILARETGRGVRP